jgi:hypothetical protein
MNWSERDSLIMPCGPHGDETKQTEEECQERQVQNVTEKLLRMD